jgi:hypothetical protein
MGKAGAGLGGLGIVGVVLAVLFMVILPGGGSGFDVGIPQLPGVNPAEQGNSGLPADPAEEELRTFVIDVQDDVQLLWSDQFQAGGRDYRPAGLVVFSDGTVSGCGAASSATGPFYCPADGKVYIDLGFFQDLQSRFGAPGDFAQAYVIAHEVGHHVQTLLGINEQVQQLSRQNPDQANELSILLELQADCFAGVWGHSIFSQGGLERGEVREALGAAAAVGDDRIQRSTTGRIDPESWTHGSSEQRVEWFQKGFESGDPNVCNTFESGG